MSGMKGFERQLMRNDQGEYPLHRPKGYQRAERLREKTMKRRTWYKPFDAVMFYPTTPRGELAQRMREVTREVAERHDLNVKIVERGGVSLRSQVRRSENKGRCQDRSKCFVHRHGKLWSGRCCILRCVRKMQ